MSKGAGPLRVAFQGERGAFSEEAAVKLLGEGVQLVPRPTFESLFASASSSLTRSSPLNSILSSLMDCGGCCARAAGASTKRHAAQSATANFTR